MADAAFSVADYFKGRLAYINVMCNLSVDCDCCAVAEDPCMKDIGILAGLDPVALDQACIDLIYRSDNPEGSILSSGWRAETVSIRLKLKEAWDREQRVPADGALKARSSAEPKALRVPGIPAASYRLPV